MEHPPGKPGCRWTGRCQACRRTGKLLVVVTSSTADSNSTAFVATLKGVVSGASSELAPLFTEMPAERYDAELKRIGVKTHPTLILYRPGPRTIELLGSRSGFQTVRQALAWLDSNGVLKTKTAASLSAQTQAPTPPLPGRSEPKPESAQHDPELQKTGGQSPSGSEQHPYPTEQGYRPTPQPPAKVPMICPPPQPTYQPAPVTPVYTQAAPQPVVVSAPSPPVVFQPSAPTIVVGPTPQPNIVFANAPQSVPNVTIVNAGNAPQPGNAPQAQPPQLFLANAPQPQPPQAYAPQPQPPQAYAPQPTMAYAPQPQPMMAYAPQPQPMMAYAPQPQPMMAYAPQPQPAMGYAPQPTGNSPLLAAALLTNPRLTDRILGAIGEHLAQRKNPRIQMSSQPTIAQAPVASAATGYAPVLAPMPGMARATRLLPGGSAAVRASASAPTPAPALLLPAASDERSLSAERRCAVSSEIRDSGSSPFDALGSSRAHLRPLTGQATAFHAGGGLGRRRTHKRARDRCPGVSRTPVSVLPVDPESIKVRTDSEVNRGGALEPQRAAGFLLGLGGI